MEKIIGDEKMFARMLLSNDKNYSTETKTALIDNYFESILLKINNELALNNKIIVKIIYGIDYLPDNIFEILSQVNSILLPQNINIKKFNEKLSFVNNNHNIKISHYEYDAIIDDLLDDNNSDQLIL